MMLKKYTLVSKHPTGTVTCVAYSILHPNPTPKTVVSLVDLCITNNMYQMFNMEVIALTEKLMHNVLYILILRDSSEGNQICEAQNLRPQTPSCTYYELLLDVIYIPQLCELCNVGHICMKWYSN